MSSAFSFRKSTRCVCGGRQQGLSLQPEITACCPWGAVVGTDQLCQDVLVYSCLLATLDQRAFGAEVLGDSGPSAGPTSRVLHSAEWAGCRLWRPPVATIPAGKVCLRPGDQGNAPRQVCHSRDIYFLLLLCLSPAISLPPTSAGPMHTLLPSPRFTQNSLTTGQCLKRRVYFGFLF